VQAGGTGLLVAAPRRVGLRPDPLRPTCAHLVDPVNRTPVGVHNSDRVDSEPPSPAGQARFSACTPLSTVDRTWAQDFSGRPQPFHKISTGSTLTRGPSRAWMASWSRRPTPPPPRSSSFD